ncbi:MAG: sigma-54-dependent transcriptional regulator [Candidatus Eiseniibacteriota bacterium]
MAKGESPTQTQGAKTILIVDDERTLRFSLGEWARDAGFVPLEAASESEALERIRDHEVDVVVLDLKLADEDGMQVLRRLREVDPVLPVVMLTGHGTVEHAVRATRLGAYDFVLKPPDLEHLDVVLHRAMEHARLRREVDHLRAGTTMPVTLLGESAGLKQVMQQLDKAARGPATKVLIQGETGTGKELMARYLHGRSARAAGPFIDLNCSAIPEQLLESQLFGHEKGAFTDAKHFKKGLFDLADGGTLFLDEIGEMAPQLQSKLLRVLETRTFRRVGGHADVQVDVRIVAATHRDLKRQVAEGRFREDLYFRLSAVPILMPPLRERREDVEVLARHFIGQFCGEMGRSPARLHPAALQALADYAWPGNVRELKYVIERVLLLETEEDILLQHLPAEISSGAPAAEGPGAARFPTGDPFPPGVVRPLAQIEQMAIGHAIAVCEGNKTRAAQMLGISRQTLRTKLNELRMEDEPESPTDA